MAEIFFGNGDTTLNSKITIKRYKAGSNYGIYVDSSTYKAFYLFNDTTMLENDLWYGFEPQYDYVISV